MKKRLFSFLMALCLIVSAFPVMAFATETEDTMEIAVVTDEAVVDSAEPEVLAATEESEEEEEEEEIPRSGRCGDYTYWELDDQGKLTITGEGKIKGDTFEGAAPWYELRREITAVDLAETITEIGNNAFNGCVNLTEVQLPIQLERIGDAFIGCTGLKKITFYGDAPEFYPQLGDVRTFEDVTATVYYPANNATWTADVMQNYGGNLTWESFDKDGSILASGTCGVNATWSLTGSGVLTISGTGPMTDYPRWDETPWYAYMETVKKVIIENGITTIGSSSFNSFINMTEISIPDSVVHIGALSLTGCVSLKSVDIPDDVTVIEEGAFGSCTGLTEIDLPDALTEVGGMAFVQNQFTSLVIPARVKKIGENAFSSDTLKKITFEGNAPKMMDGSFWGVSATAYYPAGNPTWTDEVLSGDYTYDEPLKWVPYCPGGHNFVDGVCAKCGTAKISAPVITASNAASSGKNRLTWEAVEDAVTYHVFRADSKTGDFEFLSAVPTNEFIHNDAAPGETHYYYVEAIAEDGTASVASNIVGRACDTAQPVVTVSNVPSTGKVRVSWEAVEGAVKYQVYASTSKNGPYTRFKTTDKTVVAHTAGEPGVTYYYKVRAIAEKTAANSAYSLVKSRACDLPRTTVSLSNVASTGKVRISWKAVDGAVKYQVYVSTSQDGTYKRISTTAKTAITHTSGEPGVTYYYKVKAIASVSAGNSAYSLVKTRTCDLAQPEITVSWDANGRPRVTWESVEGAVKYQVYRASSPDGTYTRRYTTAGNSYTNSGAASGATYYYKVRALAAEASGNSAFSEAKAPVVMLDQPQVSITLTAKGKPRLTWTAVTGAVKYEVYRATSPNGTYSLKYTTSGTSYTNSGAETGTTYYYKVKAIGTDGVTASPYSEKVFINCSMVGFSDSVEVRRFVEYLNEYREMVDLEKLEWYGEGLDAAKIRAAELHELPSVENRPHGASPEKLWADYGVSIEMCLVTEEDITTEDLVDALMYSEDLYDYGVVCLMDIWSGAVAARNGEYWVIMFVEK